MRPPSTGTDQVSIDGRLYIVTRDWKLLSRGGTPLGLTESEVKRAIENGILVWPGEALKALKEELGATSVRAAPFTISTSADGKLDGIGFYVVARLKRPIAKKFYGLLGKFFIVDKAIVALSNEAKVITENYFDEDPRVVAVRMVPHLKPVRASNISSAAITVEEVKDDDTTLITVMVARYGTVRNFFMRAVRLLRRFEPNRNILKNNGRPEMIVSMGQTTIVSMARYLGHSALLILDSDTSYTKQIVENF